MALSYEYDGSLSAVITKASDCITVDEALEYFDSICKDTDIDGPFVEIVNFTSTDYFDFGYLESNIILNKIAEMKTEKEYLGSVLIADDQLTQGMSNMFRSIGECRGLEIVVVSTFEEAEKAVKLITKKIAG
jgi:hypothetical protein